jgi:hypothetical protein
MDRSVQTTGPSPEGAPSPLQLDKMIQSYVALRDRKRAIEAKHKEELAPYAKVMGEIEAKMLAHMQKLGTNSVNTDAGTAYQITKPSATIRDGAAFRQWVVETAAFGIVDWRANANAVSEYIEDNGGALPPGVNFSTRTTVNFRRPNEKD